MDLWIRSQDRESLVKVDNLYVSVGNYICYYVEKGKEIPNTYYRPSGELGRYATKERALEILNEIQNILKPQILIRRNDDNDKVLLGGLRKGVTQKIDMEFKELSTYVYEMPKE